MYRVDAEDLLKYLDAAPTVFQSTAYLAEKLKSAGAIELFPEQPWEVTPGKLYFTVKSGSQIAAFRLGRHAPEKRGWRIAAAHHDSPGFRIKPAGTIAAGGYERLTLEGYGGTILHTWLDRPLGLAGRIYKKEIREDGTAALKAADICIRKPLSVIPSAAIHIDREINENAKFSIQNQLCPFFASAGTAQQPTAADGENTDRSAFMQCIAEAAGCDAADILSFELVPFDISPACFAGYDNSFLSAAGLDDRAMVHAVFEGLIRSHRQEPFGENVIIFAYDHEECGSSSDRGAKSNTLQMLLRRIAEKQGASEEAQYCALSKSILLSADMAHAAHPSYAAKQDPNTAVRLNGGPVLKLSAQQSYATSARGSAFFKLLCEKNRIPFQEYVSHSDLRGGSTIGPMLSAQYGVTTVDVGSPMLAMHSARELAGAQDPYYMIKLFAAFYRDSDC